MTTTPVVSVVVPTHDRSDSVLRLLRALASQQGVAGGYEAIVVADGCSDLTVPRIRATRWPFPVHVLDQAAAGPAVARNCGAAMASGRVLVFLDDDTEPEAGALAAHVATHDGRDDMVGLGYLPPAIAASDFFAIILRGWWEAMYDGMRRPGHRYSYRDLLSGHFSMCRDAFERLGGFDTSLRCHEDYELGYRAIEAGMRFRFVRSAVAWHHDSTDLSKSLQRKFDEGLADVKLAARHPRLAQDLPFLRWPRQESGVLRRLACDAPQLGDEIAAALRLMLRFYEGARLRFRWRNLLTQLLAYWYWRGVAQAVGSREELARLLAASREEYDPGEVPELIVDLGDGYSRAAARIDAARPRSMALALESQTVGVVPDRPGAERLRGEHLKPLLAREFSGSLLRALAATGRLGPALDARQILAQIAPPEESRASGIAARDVPAA
jgi:GT2 family glycosyltransferase